jgi:hypothetical protein
LAAPKFAAVNISLSAADSLFDTPCDNDPMANDVDLLRSVDIATVISAGNGGDKTKVGWPACISNAITVASSNLNDQASSFSNFSSLVDFFETQIRELIARVGNDRAKLEQEAKKLRKS